jgi:hypothetical protein
MEGVGGVTGVQGAVGLESSVDGVCDLRRRGIVDRPEGGDDVAVAQELHGGSEVDRFVQAPGASRGGVTGGQECELSRSRVALLDQVGHAQRTIGEPERAFGGIFGALAAVASKVHPGVAG